MGAFNDWVQGTELADPSNRRVASIAQAMMEGAARLRRADNIRHSGVALPSGLPDLTFSSLIDFEPTPARTSK